MLPTNFCHGQASQNGRCKDHSADKVGLKCPMNSSQTSSSIKSILDTESKESGSAKSMVLGRRFNDTPAIVPIKKRRIQIVEAMRSPSPSPSSPPRSPSPQTFSSHRLASALYTCSPSRQSSSHCMVPSPTPSSPNSLSIGKGQNFLSSNKVEKFLGQEEEQEKQGITRIEEYQSIVDIASRDLSESYYENANKISSQTVRQNIEDLSPERTHDEIARSESGSIGRDDRLHWDLNTDMAAWDTVSDQDGVKNVDCEGAESPDTSTSSAYDDSSHGERRMHCVNAGMEERDQEAKRKIDHYNALVENCSSMKQKTSLLTRHTGWESDNVVYNMRYGSSESTPDLGEIHDKLEVQDHEKDIAKGVSSEPKKQLKSDDGKHDIDGRRFLEFEKQVKSNDYEDDIIKRLSSESEKQITSYDVKNNTIEIGISESEKEIRSDDAKDNIIEKGISESKKNIRADDGKEDIVERSLLKSQKHIKSYDVEDDILERGLSESKKHIRSDGVKNDIIEKDIRESEKQIKSEDAGDWNMSEEPEGEEHVDYGDSDFRDVDEIGLGIDEKTDSMLQTEGYSNNELGKHVLHTGDTRSDRDETQSRASSHEDGVRNENQGKFITSGRRRPTGWDQLPEGFDNPEEALKAAKEMAPRRGGRSTTWIASGGRGSNGSNRVGATPRDGYSAGRIDSGYYGERRSDDNMTDRENFNRGRRSDDGFSAHNAAVARGRNLGRREGMFGGRGRGSGWVEGQGSPINQWGRQRTPSAFGGPTGMASARVGSGGGFILGHDGTTTIPKPGSGIISGGRGGMRPLANRGGRGPLLQIGRGSPMDMDVGMHYSMRAGNRPNGMPGGGRGLGVIHDPRNGSSSGRGVVDRYRSISGGPPPQQSRRSESPRRSSSSSSSHRMDHHHHHYPNVSNRMPSMRSESRIVKSRTSPSEYIPTRSQQRSPPPSSRWSMDKREGDGQRERDIRRSSVSRLHAPPQRTSPHVVHGSSLMDDRDRQVLAVTRHSPSPLLKGAPDGSSLEARQQPSKRGEEGDDEEEEPPQHFRSQSKDVEDRVSPRDDKDGYKGYFSYRRDRDRDRDMTDIEDRRRDPHKMLNKDERLVSGEKHAIGRDTDDDVAPRRRRHS